MNENTTGCKLFCKLYWKSVFIVVWPIVCLPILFIPLIKDGANPFGLDNEKYRCLFVCSWLWGYWVAHVMGIVVAFLPITIFPIFGVVATADMCWAYMHELNALFLVMCIIFAAVDHRQLLRRFVFGMMALFGPSMKGLLFGVIFASTIVSAVVINQGDIVMVIPLMQEVIQVLEQSGLGTLYLPQTDEEKQEDRPPKPTKLATAFYLAATYGTILGGTCMIVSNTTSIGGVGIAETAMKCSHFPIYFNHWFYFNGLIVLVLHVVIWLFLIIFYLGPFRNNPEERGLIDKAKKMKTEISAGLKAKMEEIGRLKWSEGWVMILVIISIAVWFTRDMDMKGCGWATKVVYDYFPMDTRLNYIRHSTAGLLILFLVFIIPANLSFLNSCNKDPDKRPKANATTLVSWPVFNKHMPWGVIFSIGSGFAISDIMRRTDFHYAVSEGVATYVKLNKHVTLVVITVLATVLTEVIQSLALINILIPLVIPLATGMEVHPTYFVVPTILAISYSFMTTFGSKPIRTIVEAINIPEKELLIPGLIIKTVSFTFMLLLFILIGPYIFDVNEFPLYAYPALYTHPPK